MVNTKLVEFVVTVLTGAVCVASQTYALNATKELKW